MRYRLTPRLSTRLTVSNDNLFDTNVYGGLTWSFGGSGKVPQTLEDKLTLPRPELLRLPFMLRPLAELAGHRPAGRLRFG